MSKFIAIDFETANNREDSACAIALVMVENTKIIKEEYHLIKPPLDYFTYTNLHGIKYKDLESALTFGELWPSISPMFEGIDFITAHFAKFDKGVLEACCKKYNYKPPIIPYKCTCEISRSKWNVRPTTLPNVCKRLSIPLEHHNALSDARACAKIMIAIERSS